MDDKKIGIKDSTIITYLREICVHEDSVLKILDNIKKNQNIWQDVYKDYNDHLHTYSGEPLKRDVDVRDQVKESITNVATKLVQYAHEIDSMPVSQLQENLREFSQKCIEELHVEHEVLPIKEEDLEIERDFDLIIANYVLHHLTLEYRKHIYKWLLDSSKDYAFFAVSDPLLGASEFNRRYFNFTDEGVFASFGDLGRYIKEVEIIENENGYQWKAIDRDSDEKGFYVVFKKAKIKHARERIENHVKINEFDTAINEINKAVEKHPELASELINVRKKLEAMKVSTITLEHLRDDLERDNIVREQYHVESKKLRIDIERSRNEANLLTILHHIPDEKKKSELLQLKDAIRSNKDFIIVVLEIMKAIVMPNW